MNASGERARPFYGWYVVYAVLLVLTTGSGLAFYNLSVLLDAFVRERGFPVSLASGATASFFVATGLAGVAVGMVINRIDVRIVMTGSAVIGALALASAGFLHETWQLYAFHVVFGLCYGGCGLVPSTTVVARWFRVQRPFAMSIASVGLSLGGIIFTPIAALLIRRMGLEASTPLLGLLFLVGIVPVTLLIVRESPEAKGLQPDGGPVRSAVALSTEPVGVVFADAVRTRFFTIVAVAYVFASGAQVGCIAHLYRLADERGGVGIATTALALLAIASVAGRIAGGWTMQRVAVRTFAPIVIAFQGAFLLLLAWSPSAATLLTAVALFGLTVGNVLIVQSLLLAEAFGARDYGRIYSVNQLIAMVGVAGGPAVMGVLYEATGGYGLSYGAAAIASVVGSVVVMLGRSDGRRRTTENR